MKQSDFMGVVVLCSLGWLESSKSLKQQLQTPSSLVYNSAMFSVLRRAEVKSVSKKNFY